MIRGAVVPLGDRGAGWKSHAHYRRSTHEEPGMAPAGWFWEESSPDAGRKSPVRRKLLGRRLSESARCRAPKRDIKRTITDNRAAYMIRRERNRNPIPYRKHSRRRVANGTRRRGIAAIWGAMNVVPIGA